MSNPADGFGVVPANMFGPMSPEFFGIVGRVVMIAALIEYKLSVVVTQLDRAPEGEYAGQSISELLKRLDKLAKEGELPAALAGLAPELQSLSHERNAIVHSLWPSPTMERAYGWRGIVARRREDGDHIAEVIYDRDTLHELIGRLVAVHSELHGLLASGALTRPAT